MIDSLGIALRGVAQGKGGSERPPGSDMTSPSPSPKLGAGWAQPLGLGAKKDAGDGAGREAERRDGSLSG